MFHMIFLVETLNIIFLVETLIITSSLLSYHQQLGTLFGTSLNPISVDILLFCFLGHLRAPPPIRQGFLWRSAIGQCLVTSERVIK